MTRGVLRENCIYCGRPVSEVGRLSTRGRCGECADTRMIENYRDLHSHAGPFFDHWRRRTLAAFGVGLVDDASEQG